MITQYNVGLVISQIGMTDRQLAWFMAELKHRANFLEDSLDGSASEVTIFVPSFTMLRRDANGGIPTRICNRPLPAKCKMQIVECPDDSKSSHHYIMNMMAMMDEVWCMPTYGQIHALSRGRPSVVYRAGLRLIPQDARKFKWIVPWAEVQQPAEKRKKGKKNGRPISFGT
jgi:hypothetical protein